MVTQEEFKPANNFLPWQKDGDTQQDKFIRAKELFLGNGIISGIELDTAPGAGIYLENLQGTKENPINISGVGNATYYFNKKPDMLQLILIENQLP